MPEYFKWDSITTEDLTDDNVTSLYDRGYVFTRISRGSMNQTRSIRIIVSEFSPNSENRRVLRKVDHMRLCAVPVPLRPCDYNWNIQKLGKEYYEKKFGPKTFSAYKIKELLTDPGKSHYNLLLKYSERGETVGYAICYENGTIMHYAYPFYDLNKFSNNYGMGMMLLAILYAQQQANRYLYLGSVSKPEDRYKLQFDGLEWFDGEKWRKDLEELKDIIK